MSVDPRNGAPKKLTPPRNQSSEHMVTAPDGGKFIARNVSKTESAELITGKNAPRSDGGTVPKASLGAGNVPVHPGMTAKQKAACDTSSGDRVLGNAVQSGSKKMPGC